MVRSTQSNKLNHMFILPIIHFSFTYHQTHMMRTVKIGLNIQGGRNVASVSLLEQNDSCLLLIRDMLGVKLFRFDETTLSVMSLMRGHC